MDSTTEMLFFMNYADSRDWQFLGGLMVMFLILACVGLLGYVVYITYEAYKKYKRTKILERISLTRTHSRDDLWGVYDGRMIKIRDLEDTHVANIIDFLKKNRAYDLGLIIFMKKELEIRGISDKFSNRSQIPYKNLNGKWEIWNFETNKPMEIEA